MHQNFSKKRLECYQKIGIKKNYVSIKIPILLEVQCVSFFRFLKFGLKIELLLDKEEPIEPVIRSLIYDSARELLFNVLKHSGTKQAKLCLNSL